MFDSLGESFSDLRESFAELEKLPYHTGGGTSIGALYQQEWVRSRQGKGQSDQEPFSSHHNQST